MGVTDHRELVAWQKAVDLVELLYRRTQSLPKEELYGLKSQMRRAAVSIPSNIAEGQARRTTRDFIHFLSVARGSLKELETQIIISRRLGYVNATQQSELIDATEEVSRLISGLNRSLNAKQT